MESEIASPKKSIGELIAEFRDEYRFFDHRATMMAINPIAF